MASDISEQIKEILASTIETAFSDGTDISIVNTYKAPKEALHELNILVIKASFSFEKFTTELNIVLPARTATKIAHAMLMEDTPPLDTINADIADAMKESITQICGGLQTSLNSSAYEDLGKTTFTIGDFEITTGETYQIINTLIDIKFLMGEDIFDYFIDFDESILEFIEELTKSEVLELEHSLDKESAEENILSETEEVAETPSETLEIPIGNQEESVEKNTQIEDESSKNIKEDENIVDESETSSEEKLIDPKAKKLKMIIIGLGVTIGLVITTFLILLYMGVFDKEEIMIDANSTKEQNSTIESEESLVLVEIQNKQIDFKMNMIDANRLNEKLKYLTKYEILEEDALSKYRHEEEERLYKIRMEKLEQFALNNREESLYTGMTSQNQIEQTGEQPINRFDDDGFDGNTSEQNSSAEQRAKQLDATPLVFIKVDPKQYKKYKTVIDANRDELAQVSICKNKMGKVDVYIGPMYIKSVLNDIVNAAKKVDKNSKNEMTITTMNRNEFNQMCDF